MYSDLMPPRTVRARASLAASELGLLGLGAGTALAVALVSAMHGTEALIVGRHAIWIAMGLCSTGLLWTIAARHLRYGRWDRGAARMAATWWPMVIAALSTAAGLLVLSLNWPPELPSAAEGRAAATAIAPGGWLLFAVATAAMWTLVGLSLRGVAAAEQPAIAPVAEIARPLAHALLGGLAIVLMTGLMARSISAELTYHLGAAVIVTGACTIVWTGLCLRAARGALQASRRLGNSWPMAQRGYRTATAATLLGVVLPALVVLADLMSARLTGMVPACAALAVSCHALRFGWILLRCGMHTASS